jgi:hypothetical protein
MKPIIEPKPEQSSQEESEPEWICPGCGLTLAQIYPEYGISREDHEEFERILIRAGDWKTYLEEVTPK